MFSEESNLISYWGKSIDVNKCMTQLCAVSFHWQILTSTKTALFKAIIQLCNSDLWRGFPHQTNDKFKTCTVLQAKWKVLSVQRGRSDWLAKIKRQVIIAMTKWEVVQVISHFSLTSSAGPLRSFIKTFWYGPDVLLIVWSALAARSWDVCEGNQKAFPKDATIPLVKNIWQVWTFCPASAIQTPLGQVTGFREGLLENPKPLLYNCTALRLQESSDYQSPVTENSLCLLRCWSVCWRGNTNFCATRRKSHDSVRLPFWGAHPDLKRQENEHFTAISV